jgi:hypothetical protein
MELHTIGIDLGKTVWTIHFGLPTNRPESPDPQQRRVEAIIARTRPRRLA